MPKNNVDPCEKFWSDWLKSEEDVRLKMVKKTMLARALSEHMANKFQNVKLGKNYASDYAARVINDYFQDLEAVLRQKDNAV